MMLAGWWCNNHLEKYEFVNGKDDIPYMKWKIIRSRSKPPTIYIYIYVQYVEYIHEYIYSIPSNIPEISHFYYWNWYIILYIPKQSHYLYHLSVVSTAPLRAKASSAPSSPLCLALQGPIHPILASSEGFRFGALGPSPSQPLFFEGGPTIKYIYIYVYVYIYICIHIYSIYEYSMYIYIYVIWWFQKQHPDFTMKHWNLKGITRFHML